MSNDVLADVRRILVYKRVHNGDPDDHGVFGCRNCMIRVRGSQYDAVIGIGGISDEPIKAKISRRINWVGIGPERIEIIVEGKRILGIKFQHFRPFRECGWSKDCGQFAFSEAQPGPFVIQKSAILAKRFYERRYPARFHILERDKDNDAEFAGALEILGMAVAAPASRGWDAPSTHSASTCRSVSKKSA